MAEPKEFLERYQIRIVDSNKRCLFRRNTRVEHFTVTENKDILAVRDEPQSEPLLTITIPESQLEMLKDLSGIFYNNAPMAGRADIFERIMNQLEEEKRLRNEFPAVQQAFEHYSTLLHLAGHTKDIKID